MGESWLTEVHLVIYAPRQEQESLGRDDDVGLTLDTFGEPIFARVDPCACLVLVDLLAPVYLGDPLSIDEDGADVALPVVDDGSPVDELLH